MSGAARPAAALAVALLALGGWPSVTHASAPAAADATVLPDQVISAVTVDLEGDGERELVRAVVGSSSDGSPTVKVDAWRWDGAAWSSARVNAPASGVDPARDAAALVVWRVDGEERALLLAVHNFVESEGGCCLSVEEVLVKGPGLGLRQIQADLGVAGSVVVLDADADGTDELLVVEPPGEGERTGIRLLRWDGSGFVAERAVIEGIDAQAFFPAHRGESDGLPGDELVTIARYGPATLMRVSAPDGQLVVERAPWPSGLRPVFSAGMVGGGILGRTETRLQRVDWPAGGTPSRVADVANAMPLASIGSIDGEPQPMVVVQNGTLNAGASSAALQVLDADLAPVAAVDPHPTAHRLHSLSARDFPALRAFFGSVADYAGPLPGGLPDGRPAYVVAGRLVAPGDRESIDVRAIGTFGVLPVGLGGAGGEWMAVADGWIGARDTAYLQFRGAPLGARVSVVPTNLILSEEVSAVPAPALEGVVRMRGEGGSERLLAPEDGFRVRFDAPPGSLAVVTLDAEIAFEGHVGAEPMVVDVAPDGGDGAEFKAAVLLVTPFGQVSANGWEGEVRGSPGLTVEAATRPFALKAAVSGSAEPDAAVSIGGEPVALDDQGRFAIEVDAPPWPRTLAVEATDALGNRSVQRVEVVGIVDYRGLPWPILIGLATVAVGGILFVRTPRVGPPHASSTGDALFEEIDPDDRVE